jgi:hypothetical protein
MRYIGYLDIGVNKGLLSYSQCIGLYTKIYARFQSHGGGLRIKYFKRSITVSIRLYICIVISIIILVLIIILYMYISIII